MVVQWARYVLAVSVSIFPFMSGCGGGGSGDGGHASTAKPVVYAGNQAAAVIGEDNAIDISGMLVDAMSSVELVAGFWVQIPVGAVADTQRVRGSGGGELVTTLSFEGPTAVLSVQLKEFVEEGIKFNGSLEQRVTSAQTGSYDYVSNDGVINIKALTVSQETSTISLSGTYQKTGSASISNVILHNEDGDEYLWLDSFRVDTTESSIRESYWSSPLQQSSVSGNVYDSGLGKITFSTIRPILDFSYDESASAWRGKGNGIIQIGGAESSLQLCALNRRYVGLMLDRDQNGTFDRAQRVNWHVLNDMDELPRSSNANYPVANTGQEVQANVGGETRLSGLFSHDVDGDYLGYRWKLEHKPQASTLELIDVNLPIISFTPDAVGDYIFSLYVSDGEHISTSAIKIHAENANEPLKSETSAGALEVTASRDNPNHYLFDAESASTNLGVDNLTAVWTLDLPFDYETRVSSADVLQQAFGSASSVRNELNLGNSVGGILRIIYNAGVANLDGSSPLPLYINMGGGNFDLNSVIDVPTTPSEQYAQGARAFDLDNDTVQDLLVWKYDPADTVNYRAIIINVLRGSTENSYTASQSFSFGEGNISIGDLNSDGRPDLASSSTTGMYVSYQGASGSFGVPTFLPFGSEYCDDGYTLYDNKVFDTIADFNADGRLDLVASFCGKVVVWTQDASGSLLPLSASYTGINIVAFADLNQDGRVDVVGSSRTVDAAAIAYNTSSGFAEQRFLDLTGVVAGEDLSNDGRPDLLAYANPGGYVILTQTAAGDFDATASLSNEVTTPFTEQFMFGDINGDSRVDIVERDTYSFNSYTNHGSSGFYSAVLSMYPDNHEPFDIADIDGDGHQDILCVDYYGKLRVYWGGLRVFSTGVEI